MSRRPLSFPGECVADDGFNYWRHRSRYPIGVTPHNSGYRAQVYPGTDRTVYLGTYRTVRAAAAAQERAAEYLMRSRDLVTIRAAAGLLDTMLAPTLRRMKELWRGMTERERGVCRRIRSASHGPD